MTNLGVTSVIAGSEGGRVGLEGGSPKAIDNTIVNA